MRRLVIIGFLHLIGLTAVGQGGPVNESFTVEKEKTLTLPTIQKRRFVDEQSTDISIFINPHIVSYDTLSRWTAADLPIEDIKTRFLPPANPPAVFKQHMLLGAIGNRLNTRLGYQFINPLDQKRRIRFSADHMSLRRGPTDDERSAQNNQFVSLAITQPLAKWSLTWDTQFNRNAFNYFGISSDIPDTAETTTDIASAVLWKTNNMISLSNNIDENLKFSTQVTHQSTNQVKLPYSTEQVYGWKARIAGSLSNSVKWKFSPSADYLVLTPQLVDATRYLTQTPLQIDYEFQGWQLSGGLNWIHNRNTNDQEGRSYLLPRLIFSYEIGSMQAVQFGLTSNTLLNTALDITEENLFLDFAFRDYRTEIEQVKWFASFHQTFSSSHHLSLNASFAQVRDMAFFSLDTSQANTVGASYQLVYDQSGSVGNMRLAVNAHGSITASILYHMYLQHDRYFLVDLASAFHLPIFQSNWGIQYLISEKAAANVALKYDAGIRFSEIERTGQFANLTAQFDYEIRKDITSFISASNLLNQSNSRYYLYPSSPFLISVGLKALF